MFAPYRGVVAAIVITLVPTVPALAGWEDTEWGMSPTAAIDALEGATGHSPTEAEKYEYDGVKYSPLVKLDQSVEGIDGEVTLLFDADDSLTFVVFSPEAPAECEALGEALTQLHGQTEPTGFGSTEIYNWIHDGDVVRFTNSPEAGFCNLNYSAS